MEVAERQSERLRGVKKSAMIQPDEIIYSKRKTLSISVDTSARLIVRAPKGYAKARIDAFLEEKQSWILKKQAEHRAMMLPLPSENLEGYTFLLLGKQTQITLVEGNKVGHDSENDRIYLPKVRAKERLVKWLKDNAKRIFTTVTDRQASRMGTSYKSLTVTSARSRWGCCTADNALRYTFRLLYCPKEIIEYVVVHELAHTRYKNHSKAFWQEVARYMPDWKTRRKWLKAHGVLMEIF